MRSNRGKCPQTSKPRETATPRSRHLTARIAHALRAAGRDAEHPALAEAALAWDASPEMRVALQADAPHPIRGRRGPPLAHPTPAAPPHTTFSVDNVPRDPATTAWKRLARIHQARWRIARSYPIGSHPHGDRFGTPVGSRLDLRFATETGKNLLTPPALAAVRARLAAPEPKQMLATDRLWADLLSSMPLCFNLFGDLSQDAALARHAVDTWWPEAPAGDVSVRFEHSPGRGDPSLLGNRTAEGAMSDIALPGAKRAIVFIETKYHEHATREPPPRPVALARYAEITERSGAFVEGWRAALVGTDLQQVWLDHLLVLAMLQHPSQQ